MSLLQLNCLLWFFFLLNVFNLYLWGSNLCFNSSYNKWLLLLLMILMMLLKLLHYLLIEHGLLLLFNLSRLRLLRRSASLIALIHHWEDDSCHLPSLEGIVRPNHIKVGQGLLVKSWLVEEWNSCVAILPIEDSLLLLNLLQSTEQNYRVIKIFKCPVPFWICY